MSTLPLLTRQMSPSGRAVAPVFVRLHAAAACLQKAILILCCIEEGRLRHFETCVGVMMACEGLPLTWYIMVQLLLASISYCWIQDHIQTRYKADRVWTCHTSHILGQ